jgi:MFS family permease
MTAGAAPTADSIARGRPGVLFAALLLGQMSQSLTFTAFVAALPQMAADLGPRGPFVAQMTMAMASLGLMIGCIASGWVLQRMGTRYTLIGSLVIFAVMGSGGLFLRDATALLASRFLLGFASACATTTCLWGIAYEYSGDRRAKVLGISAAVSNGFALATTILGGFIAEHGWSLTFAQYSVFGLVGAAVAFVGLRQARPLQVDGVAAAGDSRFLKRLLPFYLLVAVMFIVMFMGATQFAFIMQEDGIADPGQRSLYMSLNTLAGASLSFGYGALQRRLGLAGTFAFGAGCMAAALVTVGWATHAAYLAPAALLMGLYVGVLGPWIYQVVSEQTDAASRSHAIGLLGAFAYLGGSLNPIVLSPLGDVLGLRKVYFLAAALMAVLCLGALSRALRGRGAVKARTA